MEYKKNCDTLSEKNSFDAEGNATNNQELKAGPYDGLQKAEKEEIQYSLDKHDNSDSGANQCCAWKVTAIVLLILTVLLLVIAIVIGVIWLRESDILAVSQKTSMERAKQRQEEEEQKRMDREREIRAEEEKKRMDREREVRAEEEKKRMDREREIRAEEEKKRMDREREVRAEEEKKRMDLDKKIRQEEEEKRQAMLEEVKAQCSSGQIVSISSISFGFILSVLLFNHLMDY
ncbi:stress response protein NST1-like [Clupea harengus]|uniref:Stress response protein NST1-like n=1 Tax=Clupea harengus TaxID=7950 RepID=A0A8M1KDX5_CLUHA|nr:stress response protein NST1-like [Clupea harengus]XP_042562103.1 stress response protein NST1-like [Clupea harengus]